MGWRNAKMLLVSTATIVVASQVVRKACKYFFGSKISSAPETDSNESSNVIINTKNRDINDVIVFSSDVRRGLKLLPNHKDITMCPSRQVNCIKLVKYIMSARETLDVCMYLITSSEIAEQIIRLGQKHVLVRIIVDGDTAFIPESQIKRLQEYSFIKVQTSKKSILMHHKFCIIDGPKAILRKNILKAHAEKLNRHFSHQNSLPPITTKQTKGFVMSGSFNWSTKAMLGNHDNVIVTSNQSIVGKFEKEFETLWVNDEPEILKPGNMFEL